MDSSGHRSSPGLADGIIVGAGAAGLMAALRAASLGARVILIEGDADADSNLVRSGGMFSAAGTRFQSSQGIADAPATWEADIRQQTGGAVDDTILRAVTARAADAAHFLADACGLTLHVVTGVTIGGDVARLHATQAESGRELAAQMEDALGRTGGSITRHAGAARGLATQDGRVTGVETDRGVLRARRTLLANGGFGANGAMLARFAPEIEQAVYIGSATNDGGGIAWAEALGAELLFMDSYQGQGHVTLGGAGRLGPGLASFGAIVVNARGQRFADETMSPSAFAAFVLAQPGGWALELFDAEAHRAAMRFGPYRESVARGDVIETGSLAALAANCAMPPDRLDATLASLAPLASGQATDLFGRVRAFRPLVAPYHAARITGALAHTQGGVRVDGDARVLAREGGPIPGLLAAGGAAASISGHGAAGYIPGNGLAHAFALGMIAAETIAKGG